MSIHIKNISDLKGNTFTISGLPKEIGIKDGSTMEVVWANDVHMELISAGGSRICLRTYIAIDLLSYKETDEML